MATYDRPGVYVEEVSNVNRPIEGVETSVGAFLGIAERGPINEPVAILGITDFERVFGGPIEGEALYYAVKGFFENGGRKAYVGRLAHYTDLSAGTLAASPASVDLDGRGVATFAQYVGNADVTTAVLDDAWTMDIDVDNVGADTVTFNAAAAEHTGTGGTFAAGAATDTANYQVNGGPVRAIDLNGVGGTLADFLAALNSQLIGAYAEDSGGEIRIATDRKGSGAVLVLSSFGATFAAKTGLTAGTYNGSGNVSDADAVTFAEIKTVIEAAVQTATAGDKVLVTQQAGTGYLVLTATSGTAGATSEIDLVSGTAGLLSALGIAGLGTQGAQPAAVGTATTASAALRVKAGYRGSESPGLAGNDLSVEVLADPKFTSAGVGSDLTTNATAGDVQIRLTSRTGLEIGSYIEIDDTTNVEVVRVTGLTTTVTGASVEHVVDLASALVNSFAAGATAVNSLEFTVVVYDDDSEIKRWEQLTMNSDLDNYAVTVINDTELGSNRIVVTDLGLTFPANIVDPAAAADLSGGSDETASFTVADIVGDSTNHLGFYCMDSKDDARLLCVPPSFGTKSTIPASSAVHNKALLYAGDRADMFAILDIAEGYTTAEAINYRNNTMGADSSWGALYYPFVEVSDPLGSGRNPTAVVPCSGHVAGLFARVDSISPPEGGVSAAPAGTDNFGKLRGIVGVETLIGEADHGTLNKASINVIRRLSDAGIVVLGARTLSSDVNYRYIQVRRLLSFVANSVASGTRWAVFKKNDFRTWGKVKDSIENFLRGLHSDAQLAGRTASDAFFVKIDEETTTADDILNGIMLGDIGIAPQRPAEFIVFRLSQLQTGSSIEEL